MSRTVPSLIDVHIGNKLKLMRIKSNKNLQDIGDVLSISFQQIQKYERGQNKISSSNLFLLAQYFKTDISYFFEGIDISFKNEGYELNETVDSFQYDRDAISESEFASLVRHYSMIMKPEDRKKLLELVKSISEVLSSNTCEFRYT